MKKKLTVADVRRGNVRKYLEETSVELVNRSLKIRRLVSRGKWLQAGMESRKMTAHLHQVGWYAGVLDEMES